LWVNPSLGVNGDCKFGSIGGDDAAGWFRMKLILWFEIDTGGDIGGSIVDMLGVGECKWSA
jgi:hypothetical protein